MAPEDISCHLQTHTFPPSLVPTPGQAPGLALLSELCLVGITLG